MSEKITLEMTREQAYIVMQATELLARLHIGQTFSITEQLGDLAAKDYCERRDRAKEAFDLGIKILLGTNVYGYPDVSEKPIEHERAWAVYATIRHALVWHDHPEGGKTIDFDKPLGYGEPMPKCIVEKETHNG